MTQSGSRRRGRPREFDEETVLDDLTATFRSKGYGPTSIAELVVESGVHRPSLYRTFGSKDELFATVLRRYLDGRMMAFAELIEQVGPGVDGLHSFLDAIGEDALEGDGREGCLLITSSMELRGTTPRFEGFGVVYRKELRSCVRRLLDGVEADERTIERRTDLLVTFLMGLDVITRGGGTAAEIERCIDAMRDTVETWR